MGQYKVIGAREVLDQEPGAVFYADIDPVMEARLIAGGHIERVSVTRDDDFARRFSEKNEEQNEEHDDNRSDEE